MRIVVPVNAAHRQAEKISQGHLGAQAFHINTRVAAAASIPAMLTVMTSQRAALRRSDDAVETRRAASFDGPIREVRPDSKRLPRDSVAIALIL
jgi:hypothetical protein